MNLSPRALVLSSRVLTSALRGTVLGAVSCEATRPRRGHLDVPALFFAHSALHLEDEAGCKSRIVRCTNRPSLAHTRRFSPRFVRLLRVGVRTVVALSPFALVHRASDRAGF